MGVSTIYTLFLEGDEKKNVTSQFAGAKEIDALKGDESYDAISRVLRNAGRKRQRHCIRRPGCHSFAIAQTMPRGPDSPIWRKNRLSPAEVVVTAYTEQKSSVADAVIRLANEIGNKVIVGRQTGDGDLFQWSKGGLCIQIMDPNRPPFPIVETLPHTWS